MDPLVGMGKVSRAGVWRTRGRISTAPSTYSIPSAMASSPPSAAPSLKRPPPELSFPRPVLCQVYTSECAEK
jgi:hypothetical protein